MTGTIAKELNAKTEKVTFGERMSTDVINGFLKVSEMGKWGLRTLAGELICPCIYDEIEVINGRFKVKQDRYWGIMDMAGKLLCPCLYTAPIQVDDNGLYCEIDDDVYYVRFCK